MKKIIFFLIPLFIGIGIFIWIIKITGWNQIVKLFFTFTGWSGLIILGLTFLVVLTGIWKWRVILRSQGVKLPFKKLMTSYLGCFALTYLAPATFFAGETFRSYYIKQKEQNLSWEKTISSIFLDKIMDFSVMLVSVIVGVLYFLFKIGLPPKNLSIILGAILILFTAAILFFYLKCYKKQSIVKFVLNIVGIKNLKEDHIALGVEKEIFEFFHRRIYFTEVVLLALLRNVFLWARHFSLIVFLGGSVGILGSLSALGFTYLVSLIPIPALLGSHEAIQTFVFLKLGMTESMGTAFAMLLRSADLIISFLGIIILCRFGYKFIHKKINGGSIEKK